MKAIQAVRSNEREVKEDNCKVEMKRDSTEGLN